MPVAAQSIRLRRRYPRRNGPKDGCNLAGSFSLHSPINGNLGQQVLVFENKSWFLNASKTRKLPAQRWRLRRLRKRVGVVAGMAAGVAAAGAGASTVLPPVPSSAA